MVKGDITLEGCTEAWIRLTCPSDDVIHVADVRLSEKNDGSMKPCIQTKPNLNNTSVPKELLHQCGQKECMYIEGICDGQNDCAFYISPHMIAGEERPNENSEVVIQYKCTPGKSRKAGIAVVALLAVVGAIAILGIGGLLLYRVWNPKENYDTFDNVGGDTPGITPSQTPTSDRKAAARYETGTEHISVELQSAGGANNNDGGATKA